MSLEIGIARPLLVRREALPLGLGLRLLYASDLHLRVSQGSTIAEELALVVERQAPDAVLLGGDLVDTADSLPILSGLVRRLCQVTRVAAVSGNHDWLVGPARVRGCVVEAGGDWLESKAIRLGSLTIVGCLDQAPVGGLWAFCGHYPTSFTAARRAGARLVMAGHLHGWQIVLAQVGDHLLPGALLSRWNGLRFEREGSTLLVSRGMTDLLPLRWNCPREVLDIRL